MSSTGSVYQRSSDGKWVTAVSVNGRRVVKYSRTETEARKKLAELLVAQQQQTLTPPSKITLKEWAAHWLADEAPDLRPSTAAAYRRYLALVTAEAGSVRLDMLTSLGLAVLFSRLAAPTP